MKFHARAYKEFIIQCNLHSQVVLNRSMLLKIQDEKFIFTKVKLIIFFKLLTDRFDILLQKLG